MQPQSFLRTCSTFPSYPSPRICSILKPCTFGTSADFALSSSSGWNAVDCWKRRYADFDSVPYTSLSTGVKMSRGGSVSDARSASMSATKVSPENRSS